MDLERISTIHTRNEIKGQPDLWINTTKTFDFDQLKKFLDPLYQKRDLNIILTGAGSSAFIGETVESYFRLNFGPNVRAIPTTTLVTHFKTYVECDEPLLLISFARSGNSPESNAVIDISEKYCDDIHHIAITCNSDGTLANMISDLANGLTIVLPPKSEDKGLAMTGSFTSMIVAALHIANYKNPTNHELVIEDIADSAKKIIHDCSYELEQLSFKPFDRIVFLGSGPLKGIAEESHLKVQELTDGSVVGKFDSFLGFRHGPKAVVNETTVIVFLFSPNEKVFNYEKDLVNEILQEGIAMHCIGVFCDEDQAMQLDLDQKIIFKIDTKSKISAYTSILYVIPSQILGLYKSIDLGLNPDSPSRKNVISRVVRKFTIYR